MADDPSTAPSHAEPPEPRPAPTVLVVDDDEPIRVLARRILEESGYGAREAASGRDAIEALRSGPLPDFLVTDLKMADGSGGWLVSQVAYEFPSLLGRTVIITGDASGAAAAHVAARWRCPIVAKPLTEARLIDALRRVAGECSQG
jgi:two-component system cell cycle sensor histidine kinase/response regulator CckA